MYRQAVQGAEVVATSPTLLVRDICYILYFHQNRLETFGNYVLDDVVTRL